MNTFQFVLDPSCSGHISDASKKRVPVIRGVLAHSKCQVFVGCRSQTEFQLLFSGLLPPYSCNIVCRTNVASLSRTVTKHLIEFLQEINTLRDLSCVGFLLFLHKGREARIGKRVEEEDTFRTGDCILWLKGTDVWRRGEERDVSHCAMYLLDGWWLSKFGNGGDVAVSSLKAMQDFYPNATKQLFHITFASKL
jgi:hypothetical protein